MLNNYNNHFLNVKYLYLCIMMIFGFQTINAQEALIDSAKTYLYNNTHKAKIFNKQLLAQSLKENNESNIRLSYALYSVIYDVEGVMDSALFYNNEGLKYSKRPIDKYGFNSGIAFVYETNENYNNALKYYLKCLDIAKEANIEAQIEITNENIEAIKNILNGSIKTITFLENKYNNESIVDPEFKLVFTRKTLAEAYYKNNLNEKAQKLIEEGIDDAKSKNNVEFLYYYTNLLAKVKLSSGAYKESLKISQNALEYAKQLNNQKFINKTNYVIAKIKTETKQHSESITILNEILENNQAKTSKEKVAYYQLLAKNYAAIDNTELAANYYEKASNENKLLVEKEKGVINDIYIISLNQEINEKNRLAKRKQLWLILFLISIFFIIGVVFWFKRKEKKTELSFKKLLDKVEKLESNKHKLELEQAIDELKSSDQEIEVEVINPKPEINTTIEEKETTFVIDQSKVVEILEGLKTLEEKNYFLKQDCNLHNMAKALNTNTSYLSKIINKQLKKSFSTYINDLRINYATLELKNNRKLRAYSIYAIALELGYKNADSFSKYFKSTTGISPSVYIKKINTLNKI